MIAIGKRGQNVRLASKLTEWHLDVVSEEKYNQAMENGYKSLEALPGVDTGLASVLFERGVHSAQILSRAPMDELLQINGIEDEQQAAALVEEAEKYLVEEAKRIALEAEKAAEEAKKAAAEAEKAAAEAEKAALEAGYKSLEALPGIDSDLAGVLVEKGVQSAEVLSGTPVEELLQIDGIEDEAQAVTLVAAVKEHLVAEAERIATETEAAKADQENETEPTAETEQEL